MASVDSKESNTHELSAVDTSAKVDPHINKLRGGVFLTSVAGFSILFGFGITVAMAKKKDPSAFTKGLIASREVPESGPALAMRALGWGSLYSVSGFSLFCFAVWHLMGVNNTKEFREKMGSIMPRIPHKEQQGRNDFSSVRELVQHLVDEDEKRKENKKS